MANETTTYNTIDAKVDAMIGETILRQMGGSARLKLFVGAKDFYAERGGGVSFWIKARAKNRAKRVKITLDPMDTYTVRFERLTKDADGLPAWKTISEHEGIYNDMLVALFESETGLYLHF